MRKILLVIITLALLMPIAYCQELEQYMQQDKNPNFILAVNNESLEITPVDITIYIDDKVAASENINFDPHRHKTFEFRLSRGIHKIRVYSVKGEAKLGKTFEIIDKLLCGIVTYRYSPELQQEKGFTFRVQPPPIIIE